MNSNECISVGDRVFDTYNKQAGVAVKVFKTTVHVKWDGRGVSVRFGLAWGILCLHTLKGSTP